MQTLLNANIIDQTVL